MNIRVKILVILPNNLGDIIMATPVLEGLKEKYPGSHITFFAEEGFEGGIINNPHIDSIVPFKRSAIKESFFTGKWKGGSKEFIEAVNRLNDAGYDLIVNLSQHPYISNLISLLHSQSIEGRRFLKEGNDSVLGIWSQYLYAIPFARRYNSLHAVDVYRRIAGVTSHRGCYTITITDREKREAGRYLAGIGIDISSNKIMVFQPGAAIAAKRWPVEHFIELGHMLARSGWQIIISGAPAEKEPAVHIQKEIGNKSYATAGDITFRSSCANLTFAQGCVTGDTALMHAASALGVKTYALFGNTNPVETGPYGNGHYVFSGTCAEKPCFSDTCNSVRCMNSILPEMIFYCIENQSFPQEKRCDMYKTSTRKNKDYSLVPADNSTFSYYNSVGAAMTQSTFKENRMPAISLTEDLKKCIEESERFIEIVSRMEGSLQAFLKNREVKHIRDFERGKDVVASLSGIGCFWSAFLNIRLNSVPILDPIEGVRLSAECCSETIALIKKLLL